MIECTIIDNNTGKILSKNFQLTNDEIQKNKTSKDLKIRGIYKITYIPTGQVYIGSSTNIQSRWVEHKRDLNNNKHHSWKLQEAWDKEENKDNFKFEIVELVDKKTKLFDREQYWIDYYDAASHENFNILEDAGHSFYKDDILNFRILQQKKCGNFVFFNINSLSKLNDIFNHGDFIKLFYLSTFVKRNNILKLDNNLTIINKSILLKLFKTSQTSFNKFYNKLINFKILLQDNDKLIMNCLFFTRNTKDFYNKNANYTKIYINQIRQLYLKFGTVNGRSISIIFQMLPYINYSNNILCTNPECKNFKFIEPLSLVALCNKINKNTGHIMRLKELLKSIKFNNNSMIQIINKKYIIINPQLCYKDTNLYMFKKLIDIFENNKEELIIE